MPRVSRQSCVACVLALAGAICLFIPAVREAAESYRGLYGLYLFACAFALAYSLMPLAIAGGYYFAVLDHPNEERKKHGSSIPLTGGVAIYTAFAVTLLVNFHFSAEMKAILIAASLLLITGLIDDRFGLSAKTRLLVQLACALFLVFAGVRITFVPDWLGGIYTETAITVLWLIGITNSMNFIDGMDGLAGGTAVIYAAFFAFIAVVTKQDYMMFLAVAIAGSCLGFLPFNFRQGKKALVFLGDSGSTFLGFLLASFAILGEWGDQILDILVPVLVMSVLIFDMTLTTVVRIHSGEVRTFGQWLHYTGRDHFHHRLAGLGISEKAAAWLFFSVSVSFGLEAVAVLFSDALTSVVILAHSILVFVILGTVLVLRSGNGKSSESPKTDAP